ncbi:ABC transporter permease subunit [Candidatus Fermentibacteria bacterium]|nr:ABC transporter permease subunit [Candidatus Fermentibacteria bacterium]
MSKMLTIAGKELKTYFVSPMAYVVSTVYLLIGGFFFYTMLSYFSRLSLQFMQYGYQEDQLDINEMVVRPLYLNLSLVMLMVIPMITMRLLAEERRSGTAELLFTSPVRPWHVVGGKFLGAAGLIGLLTALTCIYPLVLALVGEIDPGPTAAAAVGLFLTGAGFVAWGVLASAASENQIVAAVTSFGFLLLLWVISWAAAITDGALASVLDYLSVMSHYEELAKGVVDTSHLVFFASLVFVPLFLAAHLLAARHGR